MVGTILMLLVAYQIKHFLCDYPLQGRYMMGKFKGGSDYIWPLAAHCGVHAGFTLSIAQCYLETLNHWETGKAINLAVKLALLDFTIHFIMDRIKAAPHYLGRFKSATPDSFKQAAVLLDEWKGWQKLAPVEKSKTDMVITNSMLSTSRRTLRENSYFWWSLGFDQMVHHLTHYYIIFRLVTS